MIESNNARVNGFIFHALLPIRKRILLPRDEEEERSNKKIRMNIQDEFDPPQLLNLIEPLLLPWQMKKKIEEIKGFEIKMLIQKQLFKTDLSSYHNRFSIPENSILKDFLREEEEELLGTRTSNSKLAGISVMVVDPCLREYHLNLKKWAMTRSSVYNLNHQWNAIVKDNHLQCNDTVQLWSFRIPSDKLCFALVKL